MDIATTLQAATAAVAIILSLWMVRGKARESASGLLKDALSVCDQLRSECARLNAEIERRDKRIERLEKELEECEKRYAAALRAIGREAMNDDLPVKV